MKALDSQYGLVAILDALGASSFADSENQRFLQARANVLELLNEMKAEIGTIHPKDLTTFTFNDTIIVVMRTGTALPSLTQVATFAALLRQFLVDSMQHGILFRGSAAIGKFYLDEGTNTVLGEAVTDAAQWYEDSEWAGIHFTPRACLYLERMMATSKDKKSWAMIRYEVPLHRGEKLRTFAINWPKIFLVPHLRRWNDDSPPRAKLMKFLAAHKVPKGTEKKYQNTIDFFDHSVSVQARKTKNKKK